MTTLIPNKLYPIKGFPNYYITNSKIVQQIKNRKVIKVFYGTMEAHRTTGINQSNISACCRNKRKSAGGFQWTYARWNKGGVK